MAFSAFMTGRALSVNQIEFVDMIVEQLTESGVMDPARLYESPYIDLNDQGLDGLFSGEVAGRAAGRVGRNQALRGGVASRKALGPFRPKCLVI